MNKKNFERHVKVSDTPRAKREIATDDNLALAALDNQMRARRAEDDPYTMTAAKLATKLPSMGAAALQLDDPMYGLLFREEDEELLRDAQRDYREEA